MTVGATIGPPCIQYGENHVGELQPTEAIQFTMSEAPSCTGF